MVTQALGQGIELTLVQASAAEGMEGRPDMQQATGDRHGCLNWEGGLISHIRVLGFQVSGRG